MKRQLMPALAVAALVLAVSGCQSVPKPESIPLDATVIDLSQRGQESIDNSNYKAAEVYYQLIIDRYGESNMSALTSAEFEIAHMRLKKKHWADAKARLEKIIARYETAGGASLPPEYLVLAKNDLARIPADVIKQLDAQDKAAAPATAEAPAPAATTAPATAVPAPAAPADDSASTAQ
jgi:outer membrane protein assembly factor BamD (BamD/ComL family)